MQDFIRGQRVKLSQLSDRARQFTLEIKVQSALPVFNFVCFGIDASGKLSDDRFMVFSSKKSAPAGGITLKKLADQSAIFEFDLDVLPLSIARLIFTLSVDGAGTMNQLNVGELILSEAGLLTPQALMRYKFSGANFTDEGALMLAEVYQKDGIWHVWASGQGFAGDLSALLAHFGGEEASDVATLAATMIPLTPPAPVQAPPSAKPAHSAVPVNHAATAPAIRMGELQQTINHSLVGTTLHLPPGEYRGPICIARALTIEGEGAVIWAQNGPVVSVASANVTLRGFQIEVTDGSAGGESGVALKVESAEPVLERVSMRGRVVGINREDKWRLPASLDLGAFAPRAFNSWKFEIEVPMDCRLRANISGLQIQPSRIVAGAHAIEILASSIGPDIFLVGQIEVEHAGIVRSIALSGRAVVAASAAQSQRIA